MLDVMFPFEFSIPVSQPGGLRGAHLVLHKVADSDGLPSKYSADLYVERSRLQEFRQVAQQC
jgi:hypothetical protein